MTPLGPVEGKPLLFWDDKVDGDLGQFCHEHRRCTIVACGFTEVL